LAGRYFRREEHRKGANRVAVISARLWRTHFGADPSLVGRAIPLDDGAYTVVGIAPDEFQADLFESGSGHRGLWTPKAIEDHESGAGLVAIGTWWAASRRGGRNRHADRGGTAADEP
jgi:hypothetical protein